MNSLGRVRLGRNYSMFALMADVRNYDRMPFIKPKGIPDTLGFEAEYDYRLFVVEDEKYNDDEHCCSRSNAEKWVASGSSVWTDESKKWISHPDWHSYSWLTVEEMEWVRTEYEKLKFPQEGWYQMDVPTLERINRSHGQNKTLTLEDVEIVYHTKGAWRGYYEVNILPWEQAVYPKPYAAILAAMKELGPTSRLVFWFDN